MSFRRQSMLLVLLTVFLRLPAVMHPKYIDDEGGYAVVAYEPDFSVPLSGVPTTQGNRTSAMKVFEI
jgi:hypothetical protein